MERIVDADAVRARVGAVSRAAPGYSSTLYAAGDQIARWCADERLGLLAAEDAVLLLQADRDFHHVFHVTSNDDALEQALARLPAGTWVADLVGQGDALSRLSAIYAAAGFMPHTFLSRMVRVQVPDEPVEGEAEVATPDDALAIAAFLDRLLDRFAEQIPDTAELAAEAAAGRLLLVRHDDGRENKAIAGMLLYALKGRTAQLRFWHVDADARGQGVGRRLMAAFLARCAGAARLVLWVIGDNDRSIAIYRHYGFEADGLLDRILILRKGIAQ